MADNFLRYIERFHFTSEGQEVFINNIENLVKDAIDRSDPFPFHPAYIWDGDLDKMDPVNRDKLLVWLYEEGVAAAKNATEDYDYSVAPTSIEELEKEIFMIQIAGAIFRVLQLQGKYHLSIVLTDEKGRPYRRYPDGRIEYIKQAKMGEK